jgi:hypothetical protein
MGSAHVYVWNNEVQSEYCIFSPYMEYEQGRYTLACAFTTNGWLDACGWTCRSRQNMLLAADVDPYHRATRTYNVRFSMVTEISFTICHCIWFHVADDWEWNNPFWKPGSAQHGVPRVRSMARSATDVKAEAARPLYQPKSK